MLMMNPRSGRFLMAVMRLLRSSLAGTNWLPKEIMKQPYGKELRNEVYSKSSSTFSKFSLLSSYNTGNREFKFYAIYFGSVTPYGNSL
jgi:hypothetical protein